MKDTFADWCCREGREDLLAQWHPEKNEGLSPSDISYGSRSEVWWRCDRGHEWKARIGSRTINGSGCPYCKGTKPWPGENDLATLMPELLAQWHPEKNTGLSPRELSCGSNRKVWWICPYGHEWEAPVKVRVRGAGCPVCANRIVAPQHNDLASTHPQLAAQWHPTKNGSLRPGDFVAGSKSKVWWCCEKGHQWQAAIFSRALRGSGCPVCSGRKVVKGENDLASLLPALAAQWHPEKNRPLVPSEVTLFCNRKVWWRCEKGHEWQAFISVRSRNSTGCPFCSGRQVLPGFNDLATVEPAIAAQWARDLNGALRPEDVTAGSSRKVWWRCSEGHVWKAIISSRTGRRRHDCPVCARRARFLSYSARE